MCELYFSRQFKFNCIIHLLTLFSLYISIFTKSAVPIIVNQNIREHIPQQVGNYWTFKVFTVVYGNSTACSEPVLSTLRSYIPCPEHFIYS
jgi:hypothetical protein